MFFYDYQTFAIFGYEILPNLATFFLKFGCEVF